MVAVSPEDGEKELALKIASACITEVPVIVLGSGASCAYGIRGMTQLSEYLIRRVVPEDEDSECWETFKSELAQRNDLEETLQKVAVSNHLHREIISHTRQMIIEDERPIYDKLVTGELTLSLSKLFRHLIRSTHKVLHVVTTNYDRLVEYAACQAKIRCNTGFTDGALRHFHCQKSDLSHYTRHAHFRCIDIWKVHGSVDWFQNATTPPLGLLDQTAVPHGFAPLIVTPGLAKYSRTHQEPFRSVIAHADEALSAARGFLCIGYGFSDDHIEPKLIQRSRDMRPPMAILARTLRQGAKDFLFEHMHSRMVAFEKDGNGTRAYTERKKDGILIDGEELWNLEGLLRKLGIQQ
jgi:hypothetical protein